MRFDFAALRDFFSGHAVYGAKTLAASAGAILAAGTVLYAAWPGRPDATVTTVDAVVAAKPMFRPVTAPAPVPARRPSERYDEASSPTFEDAVSVTRAVQRHLKRAGCYGGRIDGRWSTATRRAMAAFTEIVNARLPVDRPDPVLVALLDTHRDVTCRGAPDARGREQTASIETDRDDAGRVQPRREEFRREERRAPIPQPREDRHAERPSSDARAQDEPSEPRLAAAEEGAPEADGMPPEEAAAFAAAATARKVAKADRPRAKRKYRRGPSFSRSFRKLQRSVSRMFF